jgi:hypothetical protein
MRSGLVSGWFVASRWEGLWKGAWGMVERKADNLGSTGATPGATSPVAQQATEAKEQVQQAATGLKDTVAEQATTRLEGQKSTAVEGLGTVARAIRGTGDQLRDQEQGGIARYVDRAADQLEQFAGYLSGHNLRELVRDAEQFARREPALFLGGAFTLGLFAARFLKSSGQATRPAATEWRGQIEWYGQPTALPSGNPRIATPPALPSTYPGTGTGLVARASLVDADVIVGGPPLPDDVIVGGPPIDRHRG